MMNKTRTEYAVAEVRDGVVVWRGRPWESKEFTLKMQRTINQLHPNGVYILQSRQISNWRTIGQEPDLDNLTSDELAARMTS